MILIKISTKSHFLTPKLLIMNKLRSFLMVSVAAVAVTGFALASNMSNTETAEKQETMKVCHKGKTIEISTSAFPAHFSHGDMPGECN